MNVTRGRSSTGFSSPTSPFVPNKPPIKTENVQVTVRVRPPNAQELEVATLFPTWDIDPLANKIALASEFAERMRKPIADFTFDQLMDGSDNLAIYSQSVSHVVQSAMEGYNGTVFAYGQTASGKTYTMAGTPSQPGVIPQTIQEVFDYIKESSDRREYLLRVSYIEIYNETIRDLLSPSTPDLRIHDDKKRGVYVSPLKEEVVNTPEQVIRVLKIGEANRHIGATDFNTHSSRSHSIFQLIIESREHSGLGIGTPVRFRSNSQPFREMGVRISQLNLIDLAGSEKASGSMERRKEGAFINKSLLTLGTVIAKLTDEKSAHIPFRDSKLTRILQSSLSGHARVSVICTASPAALNYEETMNTLKFASRVKRVTIRAETHQIVDDKALLQKYRLEILDLKNKLSQVNDTISRDHEVSILRQEKQKYEEEIMEMQMSRTALKERIDHLTKLILTSSSVASKAIISYSPKAPIVLPSAPAAMSSSGEAGENANQELHQKIANQDDEIARLRNQLSTLIPPSAQTPTPDPSPSQEPDNDITQHPQYEGIAQTIQMQNHTIAQLRAELTNCQPPLPAMNMNMVIPPTTSPVLSAAASIMNSSRPPYGSPPLFPSRRRARSIASYGGGGGGIGSMEDNLPLPSSPLVAPVSIRIPTPTGSTSPITASATLVSPTSAHSGGRHPWPPSLTRAATTSFFPLVKAQSPESLDPPALGAGAGGRTNSTPGPTGDGPEGEDTRVDSGQEEWGELGGGPRSITPANRPGSPSSLLHTLSGRPRSLYHFYQSSPPIQVNAVSEARVKDLKQQLANEKKLHQNNVAQYRQKIVALEAEITLYKAEIDSLKHKLHNV